MSEKMILGGRRGGKTTGQIAKAKLARHDRYTEVARTTGRVIFGQLWMPDPTYDDVLKACFVDEIAGEINRPFTLRAMFDK